MLELNQIYCGDCIEWMKEMEDNVIDLTVTSPPYDNLRDYQGYKFDFYNLAHQLYRVTKPGGVVVWVVSDETVNGSETGTSFRQALYFIDVCGFLLHDTMIYKKLNFSKPEKVRYHNTFEYMFVFSKGQPKTFNPIKDRRNKEVGKGTVGRNQMRQKDGSTKQQKQKITAVYGMRHNVWELKTAGQEKMGQISSKTFRHPAQFPEKLANDHIISWSNEGDVVLDPMCGSGTTCKMARINNRNWIGMDVSSSYCNIARERIKEDTVEESCLEEREELISSIFQ